VVLDITVRLSFFGETSLALQPVAARQAKPPHIPTQWRLPKKLPTAIITDSSRSESKDADKFMC